MVDDSKTLRLVVGKALSPLGYDVTEATNGFNALFAMERQLPHLILLDINMPIMGGLEFLELVKQKPALHSIPIVMLASPTDHLVIPEIARLGVNGTLVKPFTPEALVETVRRVLPLPPR